MSVPAEDQRRRAAHWRHIVATTLRSFGLDAEARLPAKRPTGAFDPQPDVRTPGLGCFVKAVPTDWQNIATYLRRAELDADARGLGEVPLVVRPAPGQAPEDAYTILRLRDFAPLARDAELWRSAATQGDLIALEARP